MTEPGMIHEAPRPWLIITVGTLLLVLVGILWEMLKKALEGKR